MLGGRLPASGSFDDTEELQSLKGDGPHLGLKSSQEERKPVRTACKVASYWVSSGPPGPKGTSHCVRVFGPPASSLNLWVPATILPGLSPVPVTYLFSSLVSQGNSKRHRKGEYVSFESSYASYHYRAKTFAVSCTEDLPRPRAFACTLGVQFTDRNRGLKSAEQIKYHFPM